MSLWLQIVGKLASEIAVLLQGKDKPIFSPKKNCGDVVVVINAAHVHFTHDTWNTKLYRWHTGMWQVWVKQGGLRERKKEEGRGKEEGRKKGRGKGRRRKERGSSREAVIGR